MSTPPTDAEHERAVAEFMDAARATDPERVAEVERRLVVLGPSELAWRQSKEVALPEAA